MYVISLNAWYWLYGLYFIIVQHGKKFISCLYIKKEHSLLPMNGRSTHFGATHI